MQKRIAKVAQEYAGRQVQVGEGFYVEPQDVVLLLTIGRIEPQDGDVAPGFMHGSVHGTAPQGYATRVMTTNLHGPNGARRTYKSKATK